MAPDKLGVGVLLCTCLLHGIVTFGVNNVSGRSTDTAESTGTAESRGIVTNQTKLPTNQNQFAINNRVDIDEKCVTSPEYPNDYPNNAHHFKALTVAAGKAIEITFHEFDVEKEDSCSYDYLQFVKNSEKLCGNTLPGKLTISTNSAILEFRSDDSVRRKGYKFCYKPVTPSTNECGKENPARRISGGSFTRAHQYPWMVRLPIGCGGALVTDRHILTAKHCVDHTNWRGTKAKVAVHDQHDPNDYQEVEIKDYVWPDGNDHDIAIVILEAPVDLNDINIGTVCLPSSANKDYKGEEALAMGWGWTPETSSQSRLLQKLKLKVTQRQAKNWLWTDVVLKGGVPLDVCRGDSRGPLVHKEGGKWTVIGTVSGGAYCDNHTGQDGLWNKVTDHLQWIKNVIGQ